MGLVELWVVLQCTVDGLTQELPVFHLNGHHGLCSLLQKGIGPMHMARKPVSGVVVFFLVHLFVDDSLLGDPVRPASPLLVDL